MDVILQVVDQHLLTPKVYPAQWPESNPLRQFLSLFVIVGISGYIIYFLSAGLSYWFVYDHSLKKHPKFLKNQIRREIMCTSLSVPVMNFLSCCVFLLEVRGHSNLYNAVDESRYGWLSIILSIFTFTFFTDFCIYWIHRWLHHPAIYRHLHKTHHTWKVPTPFASHAFHPVDGFLQSFPYHLYVFLFPMHKYTYLTMFFLVNFWTVSIHDAVYTVPRLLKPIINGAAHHTDHHLYYNCNYGQFFTLWDRIGKSFKNPSAFEGKGPVDEMKAMKLK